MTRNISDKFGIITKNAEVQALLSFAKQSTPLHEFTHVFCKQLNRLLSFFKTPPSSAPKQVLSGERPALSKSDYDRNHRYDGRGLYRRDLSNQSNPPATEWFAYG